MAEILSVHSNKINNSNILKELNLEKGKYILLSAHREENIDIEKNFFELMEAVNVLAEKYDMPIIYSLHPRSAKYIENRKYVFHKNVRMLTPFGYFDYCNLQLNAFCVVSDSGTLAEECSILKFPAVSIRTSTERPRSLTRAM